MTAGTSGIRLNNHEESQKPPRGQVVVCYCKRGDLSPTSPYIAFVAAATTTIARGTIAVRA